MTESVCVLLSTFNGEKYLQEQIDSIFAQNNVDVELVVRDDGSSDNTRKILDFSVKKYQKKIKVYYRDNVGYRKSFLRLLMLAPEAKYYAFADQDDIWLPNKIKRAVQCIQKMNSAYTLYASNIEIVDENLNHISINKVAEMPNTIQSYFTRSRLAGCTYVFTNRLKNVVKKFSELDLDSKTMPDHDFVVGACAYAFGKVYLDNKSYILHRRHHKSVTGGGNGLWKRFKIEKAIIFDRKDVYWTVANLILKEFSEFILSDSKKFLIEIVDYRKSIRNKWNLLADDSCSSNIKICDLEMKFKILIGNY